MGVNKAILLGKLGKDVELKYTPSGQPVATFSLATSERYTDKSGQKQEKTEWHNIVVWGKIAELCNQYLKKGREAFVEGRITTRSWDDKDGTKKYKTEIVAQSVQFIGGQGGSGPSNSNNAPSPDHMVDQSMPFDNSSVNESGSIDEDLPF